MHRSAGGHTRERRVRQRCVPSGTPRVSESALWRCLRAFTDLVCDRSLRTALTARSVSGVISAADRWPKARREGSGRMDFGIAVATGADSWKVAQRAEELGFTH